MLLVAQHLHMGRHNGRSGDPAFRPSSQCDAGTEDYAVLQGEARHAHPPAAADACHAGSIQVIALMLQRSQDQSMSMLQCNQAADVPGSQPTLPPAVLSACAVLLLFSSASALELLVGDVRVQCFTVFLIDTTDCTRTDGPRSQASQQM